MIHVPVRGLWALRQAIVMVAVTTALPYVIKKSKPAAKFVGDKLVELGEWLKEESKPSEAEAKTKEAAKEQAQKTAKDVKAKPKPKAKPRPSATRKPAPPKKPDEKPNA